jgi:hypothetical protein
MKNICDFWAVIKYQTLNLIQIQLLFSHIIAIEGFLILIYDLHIFMAQSSI